MNDETSETADPASDSNRAQRAFSMWRYPSGFVFGLACAGFLIACSIPFVESLIWRFMEYGPDDQLQDGSVLFGWTVPDLITSSWVGLLVGLPLVGTFAQRKPLIATLTSWRAFLVGVVCAVTSLVAAWLLFTSNVWHWVYLYHS